MKWKIIIILLFLLTSFSAAQRAERPLFYTEIEFFENGTTPRIHEFEYRESVATPHFPSEEGDYEIKIIDEENEEIFEEVLQINFRIWDVPDGPHYRESVIREFWIPYDIESKEIKLIQNGEVSDTVKIPDILCETDGECTDYCDYHDAPVIDCTCGDGVCHDWESVDTCPEDCITVPEEEEDVEEEPERDLTEVVSDQAIIIILVGFIVATVFYTMKKVEKR